MHRKTTTIFWVEVKWEVAQGGVDPQVEAIVYFIHSLRLAGYQERMMPGLILEFFGPYLRQALALILSEAYYISRRELCVLLPRPGSFASLAILPLHGRTLTFAGDACRMSVVANVGTHIAAEPLTPALHMLDLRPHESEYMEQVAHTLKALRLSMQFFHDGYADRSLSHVAASPLPYPLQQR
jgi:hypothetical protein